MPPSPPQPESNNEGHLLPVSVLVLACGYQQVYIAKSGLSFPAWLVCIANNYNNNNNDNEAYRFVWRSKRDFWRLARHVNAPPTFPKAAWTKLGAKAPWKRPDFDALVSQVMRQSIISGRNHHENSEQDYPRYDLRPLMDVETNHWHPKMKKGLLQLDQYLQHVATLEEAHEAWQEFVHSNPPSGNQGDDANNNSRVVNDDHTSAATATSPLVGNALGQYFCHADNARQLVLTALDRFALVPDSDTTLPLVFVEPSCGYGQIIEVLLEALATKNSTTSNFVSSENHHDKKEELWRIRGVDIDAVAIEQCRDKFGSHANVSLVCSNFLETTISDFVTQDDPKPSVIVLGGPPYTAGAGSASNNGISSLGRDLPMQFVRHAMQAYAATVICLLMPARCEAVDYVRDGWIPTASGCFRYEYETIPLKAPSFFYFQGGGEPVKQPSVIQCFWRVDVDN